MTKHKYLQVRLIAMLYGRKFLLSSIILLASCAVALSQKPKGVGSGGSPFPGGQSNDQQNTQTNDNTDAEINDGPDSTIYEYIFIHQPFRLNVIVDTSLDISFLHDDPIYKAGAEHIHTGNKGSATLPLIFQPRINTIWNAGYHNYDIYKKSIATFRFTNGNRPMSDLYFSQLANQLNLNAGAKFSTSFKNGLSLALEYDRISQAGSFLSQNTKSTGTVAALRYYNPRKRLQSFLTFVRNANDEAHNGGLQDYLDLDSNSLRKSIPVRLDKAFSRYEDQEIGLVKYLRLNANPKSNWNLYLKNDFFYKTANYKYGDELTNDATDSIFYGNLLIDKRGLRSFVDLQHFHNGFYINGDRKKGVKGRLGIDFDRFDITEKPKSRSRTDLTLKFEGLVPVGKALSIDTRASLGIGENSGTFDAEGLINITPFRFASLTGGVRFFNSQPSYLQEQLIVNENSIRDATFSNYFGSTITGLLQMPSLGLSVGIEQHIINNPIFWSPNETVLQSEKVYAHTHLHATSKIKLWRFHLDNSGHLQLVSDDIYGIPRLYTTHQFYLGSYVFNKAMQIKIGLDGRWIQKYNGVRLQPLAHAFIPGDKLLDDYSTIRGFVMAKVSRFRISISMENIGRYWSGKFYNSAVIDQPLFDPQMRMTVRWIIPD
jgi:hypothetical protein